MGVKNKMTKLTFKGKNLQKIAEDTLKAKTYNIPYSSKTTTKPNFTWVKDTGIYIMSGNSKSKLCENGTRLVCYAHGYNPDNADVWDKCRYAVGGDDFAEQVDLTKPMLDKLTLPGSKLVMNVSEDKFGYWVESRE